MSQKQRIRENLDGPLTPEHLAAKAREGWRAVAVEWERDADAPDTRRTAVPFGLKVGSDCHHLEHDPQEMAALHLMLSRIVQDRPLSEIAAELDRRGYRRRDGGGWTQADVFNLLPRLIEVAPEIYASEAWQGERGHLRRVG